MFYSIILQHSKLCLPLHCVFMVLDLRLIRLVVGMTTISFYPYRKLQITSLIPHDIDITSAYAYINEKRLRSKSLNSFVAFNATFINPITINIPKIDPRASRPLR